MSIKHEFAIYLPEVSSALAGAELTIKDAEIAHRIHRVLRLHEGGSCTFFNQQIHAQSQIIVLAKRSVRVKIKSIEENQRLKPHVTALLPLLKRSHLEYAIYALAELGVNQIQLVVTDKVQSKWGGQKELDRLHKIVIAAAEQSKHFAFPEIKEPVVLKEAISLSHGVKLYADPGGKPFFDIIIQLKKDQPDNIVLMVGPESDLTVEEKELLQQSNFTFVQLTPTILRAYQAMTIACAGLRALL